MLSEGQPFPKFTLVSHRHEIVTGEALLGRWTIIYFYMRDYTDICTRLARDFSELSRRFKARGCEIWGVNGDSPRSHAILVAKHHLNIELMSDADRSLTKACGVWVPKSIHGREVMGARRTTFLTDPSGAVRGVMTDVVPRDHPAEALEMLVAAQKAAGAGK